MINAYINLDKKHASFLQMFKDVGIKKLNIKKVENQNELDISLTSLSKYGETKKDLSDIESASKTVPELIICDEEDFNQTLDLIKNPRIEVISSSSGLVEVNARIESLLGESSSEKIEFKDLVINLKTYEAKAGDRLLDLTFMEYELLKFFIEHQENAWSREQLLEEVWGYDPDDDIETIRVHIRHLRTKLEPDPRHPNYIKTVYGAGYCLELPTADQMLVTEDKVTA